ncbi:MAG TPA: DUF58 domain-containing protein [Acidimicrobiia bacterium]
MPTIRGWAALGAALALGTLWVAFGEELLFAVAAFLLLAVALGTWYVRRRAPRVHTARRITPTQLHDGDRAVVEITIASNRSLHEAQVEDVVHGLGAANFVAGRVEANVPMIARYEVLCRPRGVYKVGPANVRVGDPLGLTESGGPSGRTDRLVVYPAVENLDGLPLVRGQDPNMSTSRANFSQMGGEDFFTLREYQRGDDLRRVHWPSSAKRDELMIRQLEMPWQSRALVLLDPRTSSYPTADAFEHAVRGAASAVRHLYQNGFSPTLWTGSTGATNVASTEAYGMAMEELAVVQTTQAIDLRTMVARMRRTGLSGGALVMVSGAPDDAELAVYRLLGRDFLRTIVMAVAQRQNEAILQFQRAGVITVLTAPGSRWAPAWREAMERSWSTATAG